MIFTRYNKVVMFTTDFPVRTVARVSLLISSDAHHNYCFTVIRSLTLLRVPGKDLCSKRNLAKKAGE